MATQIFDIEKYLTRIGISAQLPASDATLHLIHQNHIHHIPFENIDIRYRKQFTIDRNAVYQKVVKERRGGFCYELNSLFCWLLRELGFAAKIISARIVNTDGSLGPEFDHMCVHVKTTRSYLADVGYGDLFITPLEIKDGIQTDGRSYFQVNPHEKGFCLMMSHDGKDFEKKYVFSLDEAALENFEAICIEKQTHLNSYFVKNTICTKATESGRVTIFNDKLIVRTLTDRVETPVLTEQQLKAHLKNYFEITVDGREEAKEK
jgi:N-hydroxyarylamine O-acetyltransferase